MPNSSDDSDNGLCKSVQIKKCGRQIHWRGRVGGLEGEGEHGREGEKERALGERAWEGGRGGGREGGEGEREGERKGERLWGREGVGEREGQREGEREGGREEGREGRKGGDTAGRYTV